MSFHCRHGTLREDMPSLHAGKDAGPLAIPWLDLPECGSAAYVPSVKREWDGERRIQRAAFFREFAKLVGQYSGREMTDSRDSLNAVVGLMKVLERMVVVLSAGDAGLGPCCMGAGALFGARADVAAPRGAGSLPHAQAARYIAELVLGWLGGGCGCDGRGRQGADQAGCAFRRAVLVGMNDDLSLRKVVGVADGAKIVRCSC